MNVKHAILGGLLLGNVVALTGGIYVAHSIIKNAQPQVVEKVVVATPSATPSATIVPTKPVYSPYVPTRHPVKN